jgi:soluble lytic murein transglycosylase-like protein
LIEIETVAEKYNISANKSIQVAKSESSLNQNAIGSAGEIGIYQFKIKTWAWMNSLRNTNLNINNVSHQIDMYAWAIAHGYSIHWSTY